MVNQCLFMFKFLWVFYYLAGKHGRRLCSCKYLARHLIYDLS